jgi:hypothetical protein
MSWSRRLAVLDPGFVGYARRAIHGSDFTDQFTRFLVSQAISDLDIKLLLAKLDQSFPA